MGHPNGVNSLFAPHFPNISYYNLFTLTIILTIKIGTDGVRVQIISATFKCLHLKGTIYYKEVFRNKKISEELPWLPKKTLVFWGLFFRNLRKPARFSLGSEEKTTFPQDFRALPVNPRKRQGNKNNFHSRVGNCSREHRIPRRCHSWVEIPSRYEGICTHAPVIYRSLDP